MAGVSPYALIPFPPQSTSKALYPWRHRWGSSARLIAAFSTFIRRNAVFLGSIFVGAFAFEIAFDTVSNRVWDTINRGVCTGPSRG
ncbi:predicted protein [Uncinocarpus reesii 1704]|uniref:Complex III subunit 9 n=1 Tax=Uncinocarpus reesii (strain UAMH 1704) TaxID=336963 RepID=C4JFX1_UNCRE|nr:uncharacterized protein UREG_01051 [Uncinocarpus reesii 1704]EEP76202.1 predicted protein [Uncinocarpus reesii 1704]